MSVCLSVCLRVRLNESNSSVLNSLFFFFHQGEEHINILPALVQSLSDFGFLTDHLAMPHSSDENVAEVRSGIGNSKQGDHIEYGSRGSARKKHKGYGGSSVIHLGDNILPVNIEKKESHHICENDSLHSGR